MIFKALGIVVGKTALEFIKFLGITLLVLGIAFVSIGFPAWVLTVTTDHSFLANFVLLFVTLACELTAFTVIASIYDAVVNQIDALKKEKTNNE